MIFLILLIDYYTALMIIYKASYIPFMRQLSRVNFDHAAENCRAIYRIGRLYDNDISHSFSTNLFKAASAYMARRHVHGAIHQAPTQCNCVFWLYMKY